MSKFSKSATASASPGPVGIMEDSIGTVTHEGGRAYELDAKGQLFTLAITSFVEPKFYEKGQSRFKQLVSQVTHEDAPWVAGLAKFARQTMNMRSASVLIACEYVAAQGKNARAVIDSVCVRADEPAEIIGYWISHYGRSIPMAVKRGVADACRRLYTQRNALKYDSANSGVRMADVIEITHPKPKDDVQSALFRWLIDKRHKRSEADGVVRTRQMGLSEIADVTDWIADGAPITPSQSLGGRFSGPPDAITWERLSTYHKMDAAAWESVIPKMGLMAITRNLRNFDQANISDEAVFSVTKKLADPDEVKRSRQMPFRFYTSYREQQTMTYGPALERALQLSCANVPAFAGNTMVMVDVSGSMTHRLSDRSTVMLWEVGAVFAAVMAKRCARVRLVPFGTDSQMIEVPSGNKDSLVIINTLQDVVQSQVLGHGTNIYEALGRHYSGEDRVVIFTDMQSHDSWVRDIPANVYAYDLAGYGRTGIDLSKPGRYQLGGFSDACFTMMALLEQGKRASWPWEGVV